MSSRGEIFVVLVLSLLATIMGQCSEEPSTERSRIPTVKAKSPLKIDGNLDDKAWPNSPKVAGFWRYDKDELAEEQTDVMICYDDNTIYISFIYHDSRPNLIRAQQRKQVVDWEAMIHLVSSLPHLTNPVFLGNTDYTFTVNPLGTQDKRVPDGAAVKIEWHGDWQAAAKITEKGWQGEKAISFRIFRLPRKPKAFGISFYCSIPEPHLIFSTSPYEHEFSVKDFCKAKFASQLSRRVSKCVVCS